MGWIHAAGGPRADIFRGRHRVWSLLPRRPATAWSDRSGAPADRRLRAALVHAVDSHEPCRGGTGAPRSRAVREHRHAFRHVSDDERGHRRAAARARGGMPRERHPAIAVPDAWFRRLGAGAYATLRTRFA